MSLVKSTVCARTPIGWRGRQITRSLTVHLRASESQISLQTCLRRLHFLSVYGLGEWQVARHHFFFVSVARTIPKVAMPTAQQDRSRKFVLHVKFHQKNQESLNR